MLSRIIMMGHTRSLDCLHIAVLGDSFSRQCDDRAIQMLQRFLKANECL